jgi:endonuclease III
MDVGRFFEILKKQTPHPQTELVYTTPYTLLVAVVLSAQATDKGVNKATEPLFKVADTPQKMLDLGLENLKTYIKSIGLYQTKAKNIIKLSEMLLDRHKGQVPHNREDLEALPGVGRKTANVVLNVAFGMPTIAVDTHIFRVSNRTGLAVGKTPLDVERKLEQVIPTQYRDHAHHWLILHGRYICVARNPKCSICPVQADCPYYVQTKGDHPNSSS